jgi:predicted Fe-S protein YdhL (DUF1289 family)
MQTTGIEIDGHDLMTDGVCVTSFKGICDGCEVKCRREELRWRSDQAVRQPVVYRIVQMPTSCRNRVRVEHVPARPQRSKVDDDRDVVACGPPSSPRLAVPLVRTGNR